MAFLQFVGDNTDHNINTIDGKNTHHRLGSIVVVNGNLSTESIQRKAVPRNKKQSWSNVDFNEGIQIREYIAPDKPALKLFCGQLSRKNFRTIFQILYGTVLAFSSVSKLGWLHEQNIYQSNTRKILCDNTTSNHLACHRYDNSSFIAAFCC